MPAPETTWLDTMDIFACETVILNIKYIAQNYLTCFLVVQVRRRARGVDSCNLQSLTATAGRDRSPPFIQRSIQMGWQCKCNRGIVQHSNLNQLWKEFNQHLIVLWARLKLHHLGSSISFGYCPLLNWDTSGTQIQLPWSWTAKVGVVASLVKEHGWRRCLKSVCIYWSELMNTRKLELTSSFWLRMFKSI